ncbi:MAG: permease, partial [Tissierellia bacterium]|nr:permease [Tissierellia bacterium]
MIVRKIKENYFFFLIVMIYGVLTIMDTSMGVMSIKNSGYYIKEMLFIMPVIFILTALLDFWVPKEKIMQLLGKDAKIKGIFFSFIIGSISAGPIYAAFPMCSMLYKKGASIRNIVIILSSWAVIKVPMLLNEGKFLGVQFMGFRWLLTVIAIIIFSWIMDKNIKNEDMPLENIIDNGLRINRGACIGCSLCAKTYHEIFEMKNNKAKVKDYDDAAI